MQVFSDREFILQQVVRLLLGSAETSNDSNLVLQLALTELGQAGDAGTDTS